MKKFIIIALSAALPAARPFMNFRPTKIKGVVIVEPVVRSDARGFFMEVYSKRVFEDNGIPEVFVQDNISRSTKGTFRGLHYQLPPHSQGKLVRATLGEIFDVAVDIRRGSPSFGQWVGQVLSAENRLALYMPPGFAHGFLVLSDVAEVSYKCTAHYAPESDRGILWSDPRIGLELPLFPDPNLISPKDKNLPRLEEAEIGFYF